MIYGWSKSKMSKENKRKLVVTMQLLSAMVIIKTRSHLKSPEPIISPDVSDTVTIIDPQIVTRIKRS
jgi:hypothetical protein